MHFFTQTKALLTTISARPVFMAAELGDLQVLKSAINKHPDKLNQYNRGMTPLQGAYSHKHYD